MEQPPDPLLRELIGHVLRGERRSQHRTLAQVAAASGVSMQHLSDVERGRKDPSSEILAAIAGALGWSILELLHRTALSASGSEAAQPSHALGAEQPTHAIGAHLRRSGGSAGPDPQGVRARPVVLDLTFSGPAEDGLAPLSAGPTEHSSPPLSAGPGAPGSSSAPRLTLLSAA